jgi:hypothetical protein
MSFWHELFDAFLQNEENSGSEFTDDITAIWHLIQPSASDFPIDLGSEEGNSFEQVWSTMCKLFLNEFDQTDK